MAYPFANQHQWYDAQNVAICAMFHAVYGDDAASLLALKLEQVLSDSALPRYCRAKYYIGNAWCTREPQLQLERARESLDDMVQVLQAEGRSQEAIDACLKALRDTLAITEEALEEENNQEKYAASFLCA